MEIKIETLRGQIRFWSIIILLILLLSFSVYMFFYFKIECSQSKLNPLVYAAQRIDSDDCSCILNSGKIIYFDKTKAWYIIKSDYDMGDSIPVNYSDFKIN